MTTLSSRDAGKVIEIDVSNCSLNNVLTRNGAIY
jgi:hypothetical protein